MKKRARYILIDPAIARHPALTGDPPAKALMLDLLCLVHARPEPYTFQIRNGPAVELLEGQCFFSVRQWARQAGVTHKVARRVFSKLEDAGIIGPKPIYGDRPPGTEKGTGQGTPPGTKQGTGKRYRVGTLVTLPNFALYQRFSEYGTSNGHTPQEREGHRSGHTPGKQIGQQTTSELPTQTSPTQKAPPKPPGELAGEIAAFLQDRCRQGKDWGGRIQKLIDAHGLEAVIAEADERALTGRDAFSGVGSAIAVFTAAVKANPDAQPKGPFWGWMKAARDLEARKRASARTLTEHEEWAEALRNEK